MTEEKVYNWDDEISGEVQEFNVLPAGDYPFKVINFERKIHEPKENGKLPTCPKADLQIEIEGFDGTANVFHSLFLHSKMEFKLNEFFLAIGFSKKENGKIPMDWSKVIGAEGMAKVVIETYNGEERNKIKKFYLPDEKKETPNKLGSQEGTQGEIKW